MTNRETTLNACGCCTEPAAPGALSSRPGLSALAYRVGVHGQFKTAMKNALSRRKALEGLTVREDDDFSIALLDAWAVTADVLAFYQERIANEGYLRTATERLSLLHLARLIGYELSPGVAADAFLAFTIEDAPGAFGPALSVDSAGRPAPSPPLVAIDIGVKVQSIPGPDETPATFETIEKIEARSSWNAMRPRLTQPRVITVGMDRVYLDGTTTNLKKGDSILIIDASGAKSVKAILDLYVNEKTGTTRVDFTTTASSPLHFDDGPPPPPDGKIEDFMEPMELSETVVRELIGKTWKGEDLSELIRIQNWSEEAFVAHVMDHTARAGGAENTGVYVFRTLAALFGSNAAKKPEVNADGTLKSPLTWKEWTPSDESWCVVFLDNAYEEIVPGGYIAIKKHGEPYRVYPVRNVVIRPRTAYGMSSKTTEITIPFGEVWWNPFHKASFAVIRNTTVLAQSEPLAPAETPIESPVRGNAITLDRLHPNLKIGRRVAITGERADLPGVFADEIRILKEVYVQTGFSVIIFDKSLDHPYVRDTVTVNANIARATQGETVSEILGGGDASRAFQQFTLRQPPLTHISAATPGGVKSTLEIRVNDLLYKEAPSLYGHGPGERIYTTRRDDDGKTHVCFGDGVTGCRLPSGRQNITATYRKGIGAEGLLKAGQLSNLMTRPLGVKEAVNPLPSSGAANPDTLDMARENAPLTVLTLDRVVSLEDFEHFTRAFAGIEKARADWVWDGETRLVHLTVAGTGNKAVDEDSTLYKNLVDAIAGSGTGRQPFRIESRASRAFRIEAKLRIDPRHRKEKVKTAVETTLRNAYSFKRRRLAQPVTKSDVMAEIQGVDGVEAVDLDALHFTGEAEILNSHLSARKGRWDRRRNSPAPAELLTLAPDGISLTEMNR